MPVLVTSKFEEDRSNITEIAWRHHFTIINLWDFFRRQRAPNSVGSGDIVFSIISQWALSVAIKTTVLIQSARKPYAVFP